VAVVGQDPLEEMLIASLRLLVGLEKEEMGYWLVYYKRQWRGEEPEDDIVRLAAI
jgi:hypothetical protein